jgi:hypothetical protein
MYISECGYQLEKSVISLKMEDFSFEEILLCICFCSLFVLPNQIEIMSEGKELKLKEEKYNHDSN